MACCTRAARLPTPFHRLVRSSAASAKKRMNLLALPPAFLAPRIHAHSLSIQSRRLSSVSRSKSTPHSSAQNLRGALRRLGQGSKWNTQSPAKTAALRGEQPVPPRASERRESPSLERRVQPDSKRNRLHGFRIRAASLRDHIISAAQEIDTRSRFSSTSLAQIDADITKILTHFESEMKALRVMIKSKDVLVDPENAWKSASRIKAPYNAAIRLCMQAGRQERAFKLLNQMKKDGIFPNTSTYTILIQGLTKALATQQTSLSTDREQDALIERKEVQHIREFYGDLEKLWEQAFPRYFQQRGTLVSKDLLAFDKYNFNSLSEHARRNLVSQQASISEVREFPKTLSNAIDTYVNFLRLVNSREELDKLFDQLFPPTLIEELTKGLAPNASPQDKLGLAKSKLTERLPLGDMTNFTAFLMTAKELGDQDRLAAVERIWTRFAALMDLERKERRANPQSALKQRQGSKRSSRKDEGRAVTSTDAQPVAPRFVPDGQLITNFFNRLLPTAGADPSHGLRVGLLILSKVYGLDLDSTADGIVRDPQLSQKSEAFGPERYLSSDANGIDGLGQPPAELRDPNVASAALRLLARSESWKQCIALFNYLWAQAHSDHEKASLQAEAVENMSLVNAIFGSMLRPSSAMRLLWILADVGDPAGARVILEAMKRAAEAAPKESQEAINRRVRRARKGADQSDQTEALSWKPADRSYIRAMLANLIATLDGPGGLTASMSRAVSTGPTAPDTQSHLSKRAYDAWPEVQLLFNEWCDQKQTSNGTQRNSARWGADKAEKEVLSDSLLTGDIHPRDAGPDRLSQVHTDNMLSLFLRVARLCAVAQDVNVAREALGLLHERFGLEVVVSEAKKLRDDTTALSRSSTDRAATGPVHRSRTLDHLSKAISIALDTSQQSFAPKADVEVWKRVRKMLLSPGASEGSESRFSAQQGTREVRLLSSGRHSGGNRLLLSRDDYLELEAEASAEAEDEEVHEMSEAEQHPRGSYRLQRRSRHVEQELERWVRGGSS